MQSGEQTRFNHRFRLHEDILAVPGMCACCIANRVSGSDVIPAQVGQARISSGNDGGASDTLSGDSFQIGGVESGLSGMACVDDGVKAVGDNGVRDQRVAVSVNGYCDARRKRPLCVLGAYDAD